MKVGFPKMWLKNKTKYLHNFGTYVLFFLVCLKSTCFFAIYNNNAVTNAFIQVVATMEITLKYSSICKLIWNTTDITNRLYKIEKLIETVASYGLILKPEETLKLENFYKCYEKRIKASDWSKQKFLKKNVDWMEEEIDIILKDRKKGRPPKTYDDANLRTKKKKQEELLNTHTGNEIKDSFKAILTCTQPKEVGKVVDVLPTASPKRLKRIIQSITTPKSSSSFTNEDALALILNMGLTRNEYEILRKAVFQKGHDIFPSSKAIRKTKSEILRPIQQPFDVTLKGAEVEISGLLENTASRIISTFSNSDIEKCKNSELILMFKWGCDGTSGFSEYKQPTGSNSEINYSSMFMASLVPLRMRLNIPSTSSRSDIAYEDIWVNLTPGSKLLCRPILFEYVKENSVTINSYINQLEEKIKELHPIYIEISETIIKVSFEQQLTMIDGKVANAITDTTSTWKCNICGKMSSQFNENSELTINENALRFGISPLHARIRFLEFSLHLAYDIKYRNNPEHEYISVRNNADLHKLRKDEKKRIQVEFKEQLGLIIDKPLHCYGSSNDGNTARRFFENPELTSSITGIDINILKRFKIILATINSKKQINVDKFEMFAYETKELLNTMYPWKSMTPTIHRVLAHGKEIIENSMLPLGELTEEAQEARNRDVKKIRLFNTRKSSKIAQNMDLMEYLLISSDPAIYSIRTKWLPKISLEIEKEDSESTEIKNLLTFDVSDYFEENC